MLWKWRKYIQILKNNHSTVYGIPGMTYLYQHLRTWLLKKGELTDWELGDICQDGVIDAFDLSLMRRMLLL